MGFKCELCKRREAAHQVFIDKQELYVCDSCFQKTRAGKKKSLTPLHSKITKYLDMVLSLDTESFHKRSLNQEADFVLCNLIDAWSANGKKNTFTYNSENGEQRIHSEVTFDDSKSLLTLYFTIDDGECSGKNKVTYDFSDSKSNEYKFWVYCDLNYHGGGRETHSFGVRQIPPEYWMLLSNISQAMGGKEG